MLNYVLGIFSWWKLSFEWDT